MIFIKKARPCFAVYDIPENKKAKREKFLCFIHKDVVSRADDMDNAIVSLTENLQNKIASKIIFWKKIREVAFFSHQ